MRIFAALLASFALFSPAMAQPDSFQPGPVISEFGAVAPVETTMDIPADARFAVVFDTSARADAGEINRTLNSAARFINMHAAAGIDPSDIRVAVVVHGGAFVDLTNNDTYAARQEGTDNANVAAIETLLANNVRIILCGQTAAYYEIGVDDLVPGVEMALSAMTAHALLQQEGYTLNPF